MMMVNIRSRKNEITPAMREYIEKRLDKFDKMIGGVDEIFVVLNVQKGTHTAEVTIPLNGVILRGEESGDDMYVCIDAIVEKLERQVRKQKTKLSKKLRDGSELKRTIMAMEELPSNQALVKTKTFTSKPFSVEEAIMQMELLGHDFFAFINDETEKTNVVYCRKDGNYGLLEPEN